VPDITSVLLVDDDLAFLTQLKILFQRAGYKVAATTSPIAALYSLDTFRPDIIITDFLMPEMRGDVLAEKIKERNLLKPFVIIMTTPGIVPGNHKANGMIDKDALLALLHYEEQVDELPPEEDDSEDEEEK